jgi:hypothetical protein
VTDPTGSECDAHVEYFLEAELKCDGAATVTATFPLLIRTPSPNTPISYEKDRNEVYQVCNTIRSRMLLQLEASEGKTAWSERLFTRKPTPMYTYSVGIVYPSAIQLEHPDPIQLKIYVAPVLQQGRSNICPDGDLRRLPPVETVSIDLKLISLTRLRTSNADVVELKSDYPIHFKDPLICICLRFQ